MKFLLHRYCLADNHGLLVTTIAGDTMITLAYFAIPLAIMYILYREGVSTKVSPSAKVLLGLFAAFICCCGVTHLMAIIVLIWRPWYWAEAVIKVITGIVSLLAFIYIPLAQEVKLERTSPAGYQCD